MEGGPFISCGELKRGDVPAGFHEKKRCRIERKIKSLKGNFFSRKCRKVYVDDCASHESIPEKPRMEWKIG
jgi:hypothetical protein